MKHNISFRMITNYLANAFGLARFSDTSASPRSVTPVQPVNWARQPEVAASVRPIRQRRPHRHHRQIDRPVW
jgi:hypothetical protein